jgi:hypothetical protein
VNRTISPIAQNVNFGGLVPFGFHRVEILPSMDFDRLGKDFGSGIGLAIMPLVAMAP